jgi:hypothetical protein
LIVPQGAYWQRLRQQCLAAIPLYTPMAYGNPSTLATWASTGSYTVASATKSGFHLECAGVEIGGALLADAEHYLDHAAEHQALLLNSAHRAEWASPAWLAVTTYYWGFFAATALSRLLGRTVWFLDKQTVGNLRTLAATSGPSVGAGAFRMLCGPSATGTLHDIRLVKSKDRLHEAVWKETFGVFKDASATTVTRDVMEGRLFACFSASLSKFTHDWPSAVRNAVNYRPGLAYDRVKGGNALNISQVLRRADRMSLENVIDAFEDDLSSLGGAKVGVLDRPAEYCRMLWHGAILLYAVATDLHADLVERNSLDKRWIGARTRFLTRLNVVTHEGVWPLTAA